MPILPLDRGRWNILGLQAVWGEPVRSEIHEALSFWGVPLLSAVMIAIFAFAVLRFDDPVDLFNMFFAF